MASLQRSISLAIICVLSLGFGAAPASAQSSAPDSKTFVVVGSSDVQKAGLNAAKDKAIADGKRIAVEQMTAEIVPLEVLIQQFGGIDTVIYNQADKFIQYYKLLGERRDDNRFRVLVQAKVSARMIQESLRQAGIMTADARPLLPLSLVVVGSDNLSSFVLFRGSLNKMAGVEDVQISEMLPNQTTLALKYRGTVGAFAEALLRQPHEGYAIRVFQETDDTFRIDLAPAEKPQQQKQP